MNEFETAMVNKPSVFGCTCLFQREREKERERERWGGERDQGRMMGKGTQNHKRLIMCFSGMVCGLWRDLHLNSFYFYLLLLFISIFRSAHSICSLTQVTLRQTRNIILVK